MNNPIGTTNNFCGCNNDSLMLIILLLCIAPNFLGGFSNDSFMIIILLLLFIPNMNRGLC